MKDSKGTMQDKVEDQVVEATAMIVAPRVAEVSQGVMREEIEAGHLKNVGMMAIENAIDEDKSEYEAQLDEIRAAADATSAELVGAEGVRDRTIATFKKQLIKTELRQKFAKSFKALNSMVGLAQPFKAPDDENIVFALSYFEPNSDGETNLERGGYISWEYTVGACGNYGSSVKFCGTRAASKKCIVARKKVEDLAEDLRGLTSLNRDVRIRIQGLEKERRDLQRKLRKNIVNNSVVGAAFEKTLRSSRTKVKALPLPAKFRK